MERWKQYGSLLGLLGVCFGAGLWGFNSTGGAIPWAKRSAQTLQQGVRDGGGGLVSVGRGVVVAGPIRAGGLLLEFAGLVVLFALAGLGLYLYVDRYHGPDDRERAAK
jgi:hypothetical protein